MRKIRLSRSARSAAATATAVALLVAPTTLASADTPGVPGAPQMTLTSGTPQEPSPRSSYIYAKAAGPGAWNYQYLDVEGSGLRVESVHGYLTSTDALYFPHDICGVDVHIWGVKLGGEPFSVRGRNNECGLGSLGIKWILNGGQDFQPGSYICTRVTYDPARVPEPLCAHIYE